MDLGRKLEEPSVATAPSQSESKEPKIHYPSVTLNNEAAKAFCKENDCEIGKEYAATIKFKCTGKREDSYGSSVTLDIQEIDDVAEEHTEGDGKSKSDDQKDDADKTEEKVVGVKLTKRPSDKEKVKADSSFMD